MMDAYIRSEKVLRDSINIISASLWFGRNVEHRTFEKWKTCCIILFIMRCCRMMHILVPEPPKLNSLMKTYPRLLVFGPVIQGGLMNSTQLCPQTGRSFMQNRIRSKRPQVGR